jgi:hypothetical protein
MWRRRLSVGVRSSSGGREKTTLPKVKKNLPGLTAFPRMTGLRKLRIEPLEERVLLDIAGSVLQWQLASGLLGEFSAKDSKVDWNLYAAAKTALGDWDPSVLATHPPVVTLLGDMIVVDAVAQGDPALLIQDLVGLGAQITGQFRQMVSALVPAGAIPLLESLDTLAFARAGAALNHAGLTTTQGDIAMRTNVVREWLGLDGSGQKVGVLSDSFDALGGAITDILSGDLPGPGNPYGRSTPVHVLVDYPWGTDEGRAMLQIVHDIAPGAQLAFASAFLGEAAFAQSIRDLAAAGATIIVDDVIYFAEPMFMDGGVAQAVDEVVAGGVAYFSAAGNEGKLSYERPFNASGFYVSVGGLVWELHDFDPGVGADITQKVAIPVGSEIIVVFQWEDPFYSWAPGSGGAIYDFDIALLDNTENYILAWSIDANFGGDPVEIFSFYNDGGYDFDLNGIPDTEFNLVLLRWWPSPLGSPLLKTVVFSYGPVAFLEWDTQSGTAYGHANAAGASAVGAALYALTPPFGVSPPILEPYSSRGGVPILFDTDGNALPTPEIRQTPDIVAPDGVNTTFFGWDAEPDGFPNFFGTSAAAPHAAGLAALLRQALPAWGPTEIYALMESSAVDMEAPGYDFDSGWGLVDGLAAIKLSGASVPVTFAGTAGDDVFLIRRDSSGTQVEFWRGGVLLFSYPYALISSIAVDGFAGNDLLIIDWSNGNPVPSGGVSYSGGAGEDALELRGGAATGVVYTFLAPDSGIIAVDGYNIAYVGLEPILDNLDAVDRVFTFTSAISDGTLTRVSATLTRIDSGLSESVDFTTPSGSLTINLAAGTNVFSVLGLADDFDTPVNTINGNSGNDTVVIEVTRGSAVGGGPNWVVIGNLGDDLLILSDLARNLDLIPDPVTFVGGGGFDTVNLRDDNQGRGDTYAITSSTVSRALFGGLTYSGIELLQLWTGGGDDTVNVESTAAAVSTRLLLQAGDDVVNLAPTSQDLDNLAGAVEVVGGAGTDTVNLRDDNQGRGDTYTITSSTVSRALFGGLTYSGIELLQLWTGGGDDTVNVESTAAAVSTRLLLQAGDDVVNLAPTSQDLDNLAGAVEVVGGAGTDTVNLRDDNQGRGDTYTITSSTVSRALFGGLTYSGIELLQLWTGGGDDTVNVESTAAAVSTRLLLQAGDDVVNLAPTSQDLDNLAGAVEVVGGAGTDTVNLRDDNQGRGDTYTITSSTVSRALFGGLTYSGIELLQLWTGGGDDTVNVESTAASVLTRIILQAGSDTLNLAPTSQDLDNLPGAVEVVGGADSDAVNLRDDSQGRGDTYTITSSTVARGLFGGLTYSGIELLQLWTGGGDDTVNVESTAAAVSTRLLLQAGDDVVNLAPTSQDLDNLAGAVEVVGGAGTDTVNLRDDNQGRGDTYTITSSTVSRALFGGLIYGGIELLQLWTGGGDDTVNVESTAASVLTRIILQAGSDTLNLAPTSQDLDNLPGAVEVVGGADSDAVNLRDDSQGRGDTYTITSSTVSRALFGGLTYSGIELLQLWTGGGDDFVEVFGTGLGTELRIWGQEGGDRFWVDASYLGGPLSLFGQEDDDLFEVAITESWGIAAPVVIDGGDNNFGGGLGGRDQVIIEDLSFSSWSFVIVYTGGGVLGGEIAVVGLGDDLVADLVETVAYRGDAFADDIATVLGSPVGDDLLTVAPISPTRALIFNNDPGDPSGPFNGPPEDFFSRIPGVSGGSVRPDLDLDGISPWGGLFVADAGGSGDRLYIYGRSETALSDGNLFDPFGFGSGILLPGVPNPDAYDQIQVSDSYTEFIGLLTIGYSGSDFQQSNPSLPAIVINSGFESNAPTADQITVWPSGNYRFQINGGDPDPSTTGIVPPNGDQLTILAWAATEVTIYSDKGTPPLLTVEFGLSGLLPVVFTSIERTDIFASFPVTVNLVGDNNDPAIDQPDNFLVIGTGYQAAAISVNGAGWINVSGLTRLNVFGDDINRTPSVGNDVDSLILTPYADNTPQGWGVDVRFDEGNPDLDGDGLPDLLVYNAVSGVSEEILVQPSGPGSGQLVVKNAATGTPIVVVTYTTNTGIAINANDGSAGDTDRLVLRGTDGNVPSTSGREVVRIDFDATGTTADPFVEVGDANVPGPAGVFYQLVGLANVQQVTIDLGEGDDLLVLRMPTLPAGYASGVRYVELVGGLGSDQFQIDFEGRAVSSQIGITVVGGLGPDRLEVVGTPITPLSSVEYTIGAQPGSGTVWVRSGTESTRIDFAELEPAIILLPTPVLTVNASGAANSISVGPSSINPNWGQVVIDNSEVLHFANAGLLQVNGLGGADRIVIDPTIAALGLASIVIDGGDPNTVAVVRGTPVASPVYTPTGPLSGTMTFPGLPVLFLNNVGNVMYAGTGLGDVLTVLGTSGNDVVVHRPGVAGDEGQIWVGSLLPLRYEDLGAGGLVLIDGLAGQDELLYEGTAGADRFVVAGGQVVLNARVPVEPVDVEVWRLAGLSGADRFEVTAQAGVTVVVEGDGSGGGDVLVFTGSGGAVTVDLGAGSIEDAGVPGSPDVLFRGVVLVEVDASGGAFTLVGTAADDRLEVYPLGASEGVIRAGSLLPEVRYGAVAGGVITVDAAGGSDVVAVYGSQASDLITASASQVTLLGQTINLANLETLELLGAGGEDEFQVTAGPVEIRVDGGDPIGTTPGDRLVLVGPGGGVTFEPGPTPDSGALVVAGQRRVSFVRIEGVTVLPGFGPVTILGTSGDDTITLIARDSSTHAGADGVQDFTTTVNAGVEVLWLDVASVSVQAGSGADRVVVLAPAPNGAVWNVAVSVDGGPAPAGSDLLVVGTPASTDTVIFSPTGVSSGTLTILNLATVIAITGVEEVVYDGEAGGDYLEVRGTSGNDVVVHRPGVAGDEGQIWVGSLLPLRYEDLGAGGLVLIDGLAGQDELLYEGTAGADRFVVAGGQVVLNARVPVEPVDVEVWRLAGLSGADRFEVTAQAGVTVVVEGDGSGGGDVLVFTGSGGAVTVDLGAGSIEDAGVPGSPDVLFRGVVVVEVDASGGAFTLVGTAADDRLEVYPLGASEGVIRAGSLLPEVRYGAVAGGVITVDAAGARMWWPSTVARLPI